MLSEKFISLVRELRRSDDTSNGVSLTKGGRNAALILKAGLAQRFNRRDKLIPAREHTGASVPFHLLAAAYCT